MDRKATERQSHTKTHPKLKFSFPGMCAWERIEKKFMGRKGQTHHTIEQSHKDPHNKYTPTVAASMEESSTFTGFWCSYITKQATENTLLGNGTRNDESDRWPLTQKHSWPTHDPYHSNQEHSYNQKELCSKVVSNGPSHHQCLEEYTITSLIIIPMYNNDRRHSNGDSCQIEKVHNIHYIVLLKKLIKLDII